MKNQSVKSGKSGQIMPGRMTRLALCVSLLGVAVPAGAATYSRSCDVINPGSSKPLGVCTYEDDGGPAKTSIDELAGLSTSGECFQHVVGMQSGYRLENCSAPVCVADCGTGGNPGTVPGGSTPNPGGTTPNPGGTNPSTPGTGGASVLPASAGKNLFADLPLHLQTQTVSTSLGAKPNVMLYLDDSGSMDDDAQFDFAGYRHKFHCWYDGIRTNGGRFYNWSAWIEVTTDKNTSSYTLTQDPALLLSWFKQNVSLPKDVREVTDLRACKHDNTWKYGPFADRLKTVWHVSEDLVNAYREKFIFGLYSLNKSNARSGDAARKNVYLNLGETNSDGTVNIEKDENYKTMMDLLAAYGKHTSGTTPMTWNYYKLSRGYVIPNHQYRCQKSYIVLLSDGASNGGNWSSDDEYGSAYYHSWKEFGAVPEGEGAYGGGYGGKKDWEKAHPKNGWNWNVHGLAYFSQWLTRENYGKFIGSGLDAAGRPWDETNPKTGKPYEQTTQTFTIALDIPDWATDAINYLSEGATPQGEYDAVNNPDGRFFNVRTAEEVKVAFDTIFANIESENQTGTKDAYSVTVPSTNAGGGAGERNVIFATLNTGNWNSMLKIRKTSNDGNTGALTLGDPAAAVGTPSFGNRRIVMSDGKNSFLFDGAASLPLSNADFAIAAGTNNDDEWFDLLNWYNRKGSNDKDLQKSGYVLDFRNRAVNLPPTDLSANRENRQMGEIIENSILQIGESTDKAYSRYLTTGTNDGMVYVFKHVPGNADHPYELSFNYMPYAFDRLSRDGSDIVAKHYQYPMDDEYGVVPEKRHVWLLNGGATVTGTPKNAGLGQQFFLASNLGQGGRGVFAINIGGNDAQTGAVLGADAVNTTGWEEKIRLFESDKGSLNRYGFTFGAPAVNYVKYDVNAAKGTFDGSSDSDVAVAVFSNNGYNFRNDFTGVNSGSLGEETALYVYNALGLDAGKIGNYKIALGTKGLIAKITASGGVGGLSAPTLVDGNNDGLFDTVYAGDYGGNLWRFDLRNANPADWTAHMIYKGDPSQPITAAPAVVRFKEDSGLVRNHQFPRYVVVFGTGSDIYQNDLVANPYPQQTLYGVFDDLSDRAPVAVDKTRLLQQRLSVSGSYVTAAGETRPLLNVTDNLIDGTQHKGWRVDLLRAGERVVSKPDVILDTVLFVTRGYNYSTSSSSTGSSSAMSGGAVDPCATTVTGTSSSGFSSFIQLDARNGGALTGDEARVKFTREVAGGPYNAGYQTEQLRTATSTFNTKILDSGDGGGNGELLAAGEDSVSVRRLGASCFESLEGHGYIMNSEGGSSEALPFGGKICKLSGTRRISWRQLF